VGGNCELIVNLHLCSFSLAVPLLFECEKRVTRGRLFPGEANDMYWRIVEHGMEFGWLFVVIFSILILVGIMHLVGMIYRDGRKEIHGESPLHILKRRYARGEITGEEFEKMKDELAQDICKK